MEDKRTIIDKFEFKSDMLTTKLSSKNLLLVMQKRNKKLEELRKSNKEITTDYKIRVEPFEITQSVKIRDQNNRIVEKETK